MTCVCEPRRPWWITTDRGPISGKRCKKVAGPFLTLDEAQESRACIEKYTHVLTFWIVSEDETPFQSRREASQETL